MKIAVFGLPLAALLLARDGHEVVFAVLSPVAAPGERRLTRLLGDQRVVSAAREEPSARVEALFDEHGPDLVVSWFWTRKLPIEWLARAPAIGVHPSLLPRHRGPNPFFWAIDAGDPLTGVSVHRLESEYDAGEVLEQRTLPVAEMDSWQLARALDRPSLAALRDVVTRISKGEVLRGRAQDPAQVSWAPEPDGPLLRVDWAWPTDRVLRRIRALSPDPGLAVEVRDTPLFVTRAEAAKDFPSALEAGEAALWGEPLHLVIRTGDGAIRVNRATLAENDQILSGKEVVHAIASRKDVVLD